MQAYADPGHIEPGALPENLSPEQVRELTFFEYVHVRDMFVDNYGRPLSLTKVNRMRRDFNPLKLGVLMLSYRDRGEHAGKYAIIDGQHRKETAEAEGYDELPSRVFIDLTYEQEATLYKAFATVNKQNAIDRFKADVEAKNSRALEIVAIFERRGLKITRSEQIGRVTAVHAIEKIYDTYGAGVLQGVVELLHDGWGTSPRAWVTDTLTGMSMFWVRYHDDPRFRRIRLVDRMQLTPPERLLSDAGLMRKLSPRYPMSGWGRAMVEIYNTGLRQESRLPEWQDRVFSEENLAKVPEARRKGWATRRAKGEDVSETGRRAAAVRKKRRAARIAEKT